jgi:hypothetical protein
MTHTIQRAHLPMLASATAGLWAIVQGDADDEPRTVHLPLFDGWLSFMGCLYSHRRQITLTLPCQRADICTGQG